MTRSPATRAPRRPRPTVGLLARALGAFAALAFTLVVIPYVLWQATSAIASDGLDALRHAFTRQDISAAVLIVCCIGWLAWGSFVLSLLLEVPAQLRGVRAPRLPGLQISQRAAASLVGALLVLAPTGTALAAAPAQAAPSSPATAASTTQLPGQVQRSMPRTAQAAATTAPERAARETYTVRDVRPAESLWSIAEHLYGDGEAYTHLAHANEGTTMIDGRTFHASLPIQPGWVLQLPSGMNRIDAPHPAAGEQLQVQSGGEQHAAGAHTVTRGETLSEIAQDETGDAANWPRLYEASRGAQPHGLPRITDPDLIRPDQQVTIPDSAGQESPAAPGHQDEPATPRSPGDYADDDAQPGTGHGAGPSGPARGGQESALPAPTVSAPSAPSSAARSPQSSPTREGGQPSTAQPTERPHASPGAPSATPSASAPVPAQSGQPAPSARPQQDSSSPLAMSSVVQAFAVLAGALTLTLAARRLWQWRSRRPGQSVPESEPAAVEEELAEIAHDGAAGVRRLSAALSALSGAEGVPGELPVLRAGRVTAYSVQVLPDDVAAPPQAPFTSSKAGWWDLPDSVELHEPVADAVPPYPALVTLGISPDGDLLLANLPPWQVLLVDGSPTSRSEVMAALATELSIGEQADHVEVVTCGMGALGSELKALGVQYLPDPRLAASELAERVLEAHQNPGDRGAPYLVMCAGDIDEDTCQEFAQILEQARQLTPCILVLPATADTAFPDAEVIDADTHGPQRIDTLGTDVSLQRLDAATITELARAYRHARRPAEEASGVWEHVPPEPIAAPRPSPATPTARPVPHQAQDEAVELGATAQGATASAGTAGEVPDVSQPVVFQTFLEAGTDPAQVPLQAVPTASSGNEEPALEQQAPRFLIPPVHALRTAERPGPVPLSDDDFAVTEASARDSAPRLRVLGTVTMDHVTSGSLSPRLTELAAHLLLKPGSSADRLCEDLGESEPWSAKTLGSRFRELRTELGTSPDGDLYVPQRHGKSSPFALADTVRCDWSEFERLAALGLSRGEEGLRHLERALGLVHGMPLAEHPATWMTGLRTTMQTKITSVAHTVASYRLAEGPYQDFPSARQACTVGLSVDSYCEWLHRALMRTEAAAGNHNALQKAIAHWHDATRHLPAAQIDRKTQALVDELVNAS
ncbi:LysM peptidoglycan-binding domain-containing protein [Streptomyces sp. SID14478]|uniref:LysM peptidoglycan-binding domain-containing protein n=1 Tax=Streptomyces sp. SID14478 TaxID=2706073 RepID=UPI0013DC3D61|nr:LysM peptidoglycan-binding domain-containing protein [Streptomyces sp. SID14478]NEB78988.1 LysM peptidoglycan-binding domain-containing protein [Streptomyces sp. SID14478]